MRIFIYATMLMGIAFAKAQSSTQQLLQEYFEVSGITAEYNNAYDQMMVMIKDAYQAQEVPQSVWDDLSANKSTSISKFKGILAGEYRSIFDTPKELTILINFFKSDTGKQLQQNPNEMSEEQIKAYEDFIASPTGQMLQEKLPEINQAKERASIYWSKELFCEVSSQLSSLGYENALPSGACN